jgi:peptidoglycan/LPS O-acetylase OafA/YrhL
MNIRKEKGIDYLPVDRYKLLDVFRGIAILWIVFFHIYSSVSMQYGIVGAATDQRKQGDGPGIV